MIDGAARCFLSDEEQVCNVTDETIKESGGLQCVVVNPFLFENQCLLFLFPCIILQTGLSLTRIQQKDIIKDFIWGNDGSR